MNKEINKENLIEAIRRIMLTNEPYVEGSNPPYATLMTGVFISEMSKFLDASEIWPEGSVAQKRQSTKVLEKAYRL